MECFADLLNVAAGRPAQVAFVGKRGRGKMAEDRERGDKKRRGFFVEARDGGDSLLQFGCRGQKRGVEKWSLTQRIYFVLQIP